MVLGVSVEDQINKTRTDLGLFLGIQPLENVAVLLLEDSKQLRRRVILQYRHAIVSDGQVTLGGGVKCVVLPIVAQIMSQRCNEDGQDVETVEVFVRLASGYEEIAHMQHVEAMIHVVVGCVHVVSQDDLTKKVCQSRHRN